MSGAIQTAQDAWGSDMPDWVQKLAKECQASSQVKVSKRLNRSSALVNQVLKCKYKGDLKAVEDCVRGVFMDGTITCPALGVIPTNECQDWRKKARKFAGVNTLRVRMYRACTSCPRNVKEV
ncbi:MAG: hypothetical protein JKX71_08025 [Amylibacter sp.]|nr:hypothetical protein [Amylibacter sp.]